MKIYRNLNRESWAILKLNEVKNNLPNSVVSDIGAGFGWFEKYVLEEKLEWQPFDYVKKIEKSLEWDLNFPAPMNSKKAGFVIFLEVLEHLSNPELGIKNISNHIEKEGYMVLTTPYPFSAESKIELLFKNNLYAFQPKHLAEHHVFVPLPHIVSFHLENQGFEVKEMSILGSFNAPKFSFSVRYLKSILHYLMVKFLIILNPATEGSTLALFLKKIK